MRALPTKPAWVWHPKTRMAFSPTFFTAKCFLMFHRENGQQDGYRMCCLGVYNTAGRQVMTAAIAKAERRNASCHRGKSRAGLQCVGKCLPKTRYVRNFQKQCLSVCHIYKMYTQCADKKGSPFCDDRTASLYSVRCSAPLVPRALLWGSERWRKWSHRASGKRSQCTQHTQGLPPNSGLQFWHWSVTAHRLPGQCHSMLTALGADSRQPRGRVLSLGQLTLESASVNWISGKLYWTSMVFTGCRQKSLYAHSGALSASSHRLQDGHILKVVDSYRKLNVTQNLHVIWWPIAVQFMMIYAGQQDTASPCSVGGWTRTHQSAGQVIHHRASSPALRREWNTSWWTDFPDPAIANNVHRFSVELQRF